MKRYAAAMGLVALLSAQGPVLASEAAYQAALKDIERSFGTVPTFMANVSKAALPGAWAETKALLLSDDTALPARTKALIAIAVGAAIGCEVCVWMDSAEALRVGAKQEELREAIGIAALEQHWSTMIDGLQIDLQSVKTELGGEVEE
jgi:AhpD family alkylhydroperoxidase